MSSRVESGIWTEDGSDLLSQPLLNFIARRRIAFSLIGFLTLVLWNLIARKSIPLNPFDLTAAPAVLAASLLAVGLAIRSWSAGTLNKSREVTQHGPYAMTRNPLYIGSFMMMFGFCLLLRDLPSFLFVAGPMALLYGIQVHFEEKRLQFMFPQQWPEYAARVPRFIPRQVSQEAIRGWTFKEWLRNREYRALVATLVGVVGIFVWHIVSPQVW